MCGRQQNYGSFNAITPFGYPWGRNAVSESTVVAV